MAIEIISGTYLSFKIAKKLVQFIKKYKKNRILQNDLENEKLDLVVINLSGFPLSRLAVDTIMKWGRCKIVKKEIISIDLKDPIDYMDNIINFCTKAIKDLIKKDKIINQLLIGKYVVILPGMNSIAMTFITMFHGITGHFPLISFSYQSDLVYNLVEPYNFQTLRTEYRKSEKIPPENNNFILINISGKFLSEEAKNEIMNWGDCQIVEKSIPTIDLNNPDTYMDNIVNFCDMTIKDLLHNENLVSNLLLGKYAIIPPGMPSIAMTFLAMLHGITGHFPYMSFFYKKNMVFRVTKPFDFHDLRVQFREIS
ncbi:hypothetical protein LCGC14_1351370 [marine sediment metagenome]|uniref:Uncharacterized protein n=1 Tax=marine sediment metagenome TaxID=412755 RepID=A0A0F9KBK3_9ZZZZ